MEDVWGSGVLEWRMASVLEWGTNSFLCRPWVDLGVGMRVLQVGEMPNRPPMTFTPWWS